MTQGDTMTHTPMSAVAQLSRSMLRGAMDRANPMAATPRPTMRLLFATLVATSRKWITHGEMANHRPASSSNPSVITVGGLAEIRS